MTERHLIALAAVVLWLVLVVVTVLRHRRRARAAARMASGGTDGVAVIHASQTGTAERIARATADSLAAAGVSVRLLPLGQVSAETLAGMDRALFVVATTGEGDAPDDAAAFIRRTMAARPGLGHLRYGMLALGDRSYRNYCGFGRGLDHWLREGGAMPLIDRVELDGADPAALRHWQGELRVFGADADAPDWSPPAYSRWTLVEREHLNPGSPGGPAWRIRLQPEGALPEWQAGDVAEIGPRTLPGRPAVEPHLLPHREYSIASLPADGGVELVVRLMHHPDGTPGLGSGWLIQGAEIGGPVDLRIRDNRSFHPPAPDRPLILIGNGTGIAGLRAHLKARAALGRPTENWLLFGERSPSHDRLFHDELQDWLATGLLARADLAFSRDAGNPAYVQDRLAAAGDAVRAWVDRGAALYVCGSREGMAGGVDAALSTVLGPERLLALAEQGCYRRDVY